MPHSTSSCSLPGRHPRARAATRFPPVARWASLRVSWAMCAPCLDHIGVAGTDCRFVWIVTAECAILVMWPPDRASEYPSLVKETPLVLRRFFAYDEPRGDREIRGNQHAFPPTEGTTSLGPVPSSKTADSRIREIRGHSAGARTGGDGSQA